MEFFIYLTVTFFFTSVSFAYLSNHFYFKYKRKCNESDQFEFEAKTAKFNLESNRRFNSSTNESLYKTNKKLQDKLNASEDKINQLILKTVSIKNAKAVIRDYKHMKKITKKIMKKWNRS